MTTENKDKEKGGGCCATLPASEVCASLPHGFTLRASPAVKHGVSPPRTVGEYTTLLRGVGIISTAAENLSLSSNAISA